MAQFGEPSAIADVITPCQILRRLFRPSNGILCVMGISQQLTLHPCSRHSRVSLRGTGLATHQVLANAGVPRMLVVANAQLLRRDDPHREIRELTIYQTDHGSEFWERITFSSNDAPTSNGVVAVGTWLEMKEKFDRRLAVIKQEGFDQCRK